MTPSPRRLRKLRSRVVGMSAPAQPTDMSGRVEYDVCRRRKPTRQADEHQARWPYSAIPVEIFELICSFLSRSEVKLLRLVSREFEAKVSSQYFKNVVVPFRSELYGEMNRDRNGNLIHSAATLFSNGMRIFEAFGPHILRFALSLELDEDDLAYPPIKPLQQAVPAFWGIYRWPHENYHRYTKLEGLEQTADETDGMKEALNHLSKVSNLGLCCDAGLGFLIGPDKVGRRAAAVREPVFATTDWRRDHPKALPEEQAVTVADLNGASGANAESSLSGPVKFARRVLENMVVDAGYTSSQQEEAIQLVLDTENTTFQDMDFDETAKPAANRNLSLAQDLLRRITALRGIHNEGADEDDDTVSGNSRTGNQRPWPLAPAELTRAQRELLLELEWAHRAMIQSFVICLIDNSVTNGFDSVTTLTIAKIPSGHLNMLTRHDLWSTLPNLRNVSLGVIPDWRHVRKSTVGLIEEFPISPVGAVSRTFDLLNTYIGVRKNIESIHFEWICGGEFAPSRYQRNQYIVPAPFVCNPQLMASYRGALDRREPLLSLPYVKHLSIKNCWASPHVFTQTIRKMSLASLEKLELESLSLSGPPTTRAQAALWQPQMVPHVHVVNAADFAWWNPDQNDANNPPAHIPPAAELPAPGTHDPLEVGQDLNNNDQLETDEEENDFWVPADPLLAAPVPAEPDIQNNVARRAWASWPGILEHFSRAAPLDEVLTSRQRRERRASMIEDMSLYVPNAKTLSRDQKHFKLKHISLRSCGYVAVDATYINTRAIVSRDHPVLFPVGNPNGVDLSPHMQTSKDRLLGFVSSYVERTEAMRLETAFGMAFGWHGVYEDRMIKDAIADGVECPGMGRFGGVLEGRGVADGWWDGSAVAASGTYDSDESDI